MKATLTALISILSVIVSLSYAGEMEEELFVLATRQYEAGNYDSASVLFTKILESGCHDSRVYYNIGNVKFRQKKIGEAMLNYEKALYLNPSDRDASANIQYLRQLTKDKIVPTEHSIFFKAIIFVRELFSLKTEAAIIILLVWLLSIFIILRYLADPKYSHTLKNCAIIVVVMLALILPSFLVKRHMRDTKENAIVMSAQVNVVNEPGGSEILFTVHEGAKFSIERKVSSYAFATLENGMAGWIALDDLGIIEVR